MAPKGKQLIYTGITCPADPKTKIKHYLDKVEVEIARLWPDVFKYIEEKEYYGPAQISRLSRDSVVPGTGGECIGLGQIVGQCGNLKPSPKAPIGGLFYVGADAGNLVRTINPNFVEDIEPEMNTYLGVAGIVGIKIHPNTHNYPVDGEKYRLVWERANREEWMVLSHTWGADGGCGANDMRKIAEQYPDVRLILGHSCYGAWEKAIRLAAEFPNVYLELTAAYHVYGIIEWMCREAGSEKVLFGTDYPWFDPMVAAGCVVFAHIEQHEMKNILYNNARRLINEQAARWK
jgi:hypothetical protein